MKLTELQEMWKKDCVIDETNLGRASAKIPELHAKYLNLLTSAKLQSRKAESDYLKLRRVKYRYFRGELTQTELQDLGWVQGNVSVTTRREHCRRLMLDKWGRS